MLYPFGHRALWSMVDQWANVLQHIGLNPTVIATENLLLKRFEPSSPQAKPADSYILHPFSYRVTQSTIK